MMSDGLQEAIKILNDLEEEQKKESLEQQTRLLGAVVDSLTDKAAVESTDRGSDEAKAAYADGLKEGAQTVFDVIDAREIVMLRGEVMINADFSDTDITLCSLGKAFAESINT
jgi:hypothetical protein